MRESINTDLYLFILGLTKFSNFVLINLYRSLHLVSILPYSWNEVWGEARYIF